jgi:hypothetical protein
MRAIRLTRGLPGALEGTSGPEGGDRGGRVYGAIAWMGLP